MYKFPNMYRKMNRFQ